MKKGIEQLKPVARQIVLFALAISKLKSEKGWFAKSLLIIKAFKLKIIVQAVRNWEEIKLEVKDIDAKEIKEIVIELEKEFNLVSDKVEIVIIKGLDFIDAILNLRK